VVNSLWITSTHVLFFDAYMPRHSSEAAMMSSMPMPDSPRLMLALTGPIVGIVSGAIIGLLAVAASKLPQLKKA
jgi:hypothetical protein